MKKQIALLMALGLLFTACSKSDENAEADDTNANQSIGVEVVSPPDAGQSIGVEVEKSGQ